MARYADDLALAHMLADTADSISSARFRAQDLHVTEKPDLTPVTDADTAVEKALRATLSRARPRDAVLGEEFGAAAPAAGGGSRQWVIPSTAR
jgi:histidinol-phosphatase